MAGVRGLGERDAGSLTAEFLLDVVDFVGEHCIQLHRLLVNDSPDDLYVKKRQGIEQCIVVVGGVVYIYIPHVSPCLKRSPVSLPPLGRW